MKRCWLKNSSNLSNWKFAASASVRSQEPHCYKEIKPDAALASPAGHCACLTHIAPWSLLLSTCTVLQFDVKHVFDLDNKEIRVHEGTNQLGHHQQHGEEPEAHMSGAHLLHANSRKCCFSDGRKCVRRTDEGLNQPPCCSGIFLSGST